MFINLYLYYFCYKDNIYYLIVQENKQLFY